MARTEATFRAMGSDAHLVVLGGPKGIVDKATARVADLEARWSRFIPTSEVCELTRRAGSPVLVSEETSLLVKTAIDAWHLSGGTFDPTVLGAVVRAGYVASLETGVQAPATALDLALGCSEIEVAGRSVHLPAGSGFDAGGVGKGLAADLVAREAMEAGASGVCVNLGGDLRVLGEGPDEGGWTVAIEHPHAARPIALVGVRDGAVATSTTLLRRWQMDGESQHHVIDPGTGRPSDTDLTLAAVVASDAWLAEVLATALLVRGSRHRFGLIGGSGAEGLVVDGSGQVECSSGFSAFTGGAGVERIVALAS